MDPFQDQFLISVPEESVPDLACRGQEMHSKYGIDRASQNVDTYVYRARVAIIDGHFIGKSITPASSYSDPRSRL